MLAGNLPHLQKSKKAALGAVSSFGSSTHFDSRVADKARAYTMIWSFCQGCGLI